MERPDPTPFLSQLSLKEKLLLSMRAELLCIERFGALAEAVQRADEALSFDLQELAGDEREHLVALEEVDQQTPWPTTWRVDEPTVERLLESFMPALGEPVRGTPERPEVKQIVRAIEEQSAAFYRMLSESAAADPSHGIFDQLAALESTHAEPMLLH